MLAAALGAGETLTRQVSRVPENDNVTDAKVLYRIALVDADSIQPRETVVVRIAAADVPAAYAKPARPSPRRKHVSTPRSSMSRTAAMSRRSSTSP